MGKLALMFPGQGSQYVGMGKDLFLTSSGQKAFDLAGEVLGRPFLELIENGPEEELQQTANTQPAILLVSVTAWLQLQEAGVEPDYVVGHSLGEYSAHVAAGSLSLAEALRIVRRRGELMQKAVPTGGGMAAILGLSAEKVEEACQRASKLGVVAPANFNCPGQVVISGEMPAVTAAMEAAKELGAKRAVPLVVSGPFHSALMKKAGEELLQVLADVRWNPLRCPVIANVDAREVVASERIVPSLVAQVSGPVRWEQSIRHLLDLGVDTFVECGPGKVLTGLVKKIAPNVNLLRVENAESLEKSLAYLKESR
ncbi:ACP S-malonyltransferase [Desulfosporosinus sp. PR]|uniref:ACP S-malonyltransferase n=1 Tax=Candidatus Desulfosporosinus nitrosoreducens TaxID=3401928 RepID=UPI0027E6E37F|nr:ACP S-malonyltransferase [Desulfosporosinus sp. PR]MDQ7094722.1 ACP S-malonyltransferase [Desulfosporosinus sp. PR]